MTDNRQTKEPTSFPISSSEIISSKFLGELEDLIYFQQKLIRTKNPEAQARIQNQIDILKLLRFLKQGETH